MKYLQKSIEFHISEQRATRWCLENHLTADSQSASVAARSSKILIWLDTGGSYCFAPEPFCTSPVQNRIQTKQDNTKYTYIFMTTEMMILLKFSLTILYMLTVYAIL